MIRTAMRLATYGLIVVLGTACGLLVMEILLRSGGHTAGPAPAPHDPAGFVFRDPFTGNPVTGWQLKPGRYRLITAGRGRETEVSINPDASRATRRDDVRLPDAASKIVFIGDSYVFGEGLDDGETLPWRLQELVPGRNVINHGVGGYGTCQAWLRLVQLEGVLTRGDVVVYGFNEFHEGRNMADPRLDYWVAIASPLRRSGYPRCRTIGGEIVRDDSRPWDVIMPLTGRSVISKLITDAWLNVLARTATKQQREVTESLIRKIRHTVTARGASLVVLLQELTPEAVPHYREVLRRLDIPHVDGTQAMADRSLELPDGHPGPGMIEIWAEQMGDYLATHRVASHER